MGVGHYFFDLEAHVSKNGVIVGIMKEALVGRMYSLAMDYQYQQWLIQYRMRRTR